MLLKNLLVISCYCHFIVHCAFTPAAREEKIVGPLSDNYSLLSLGPSDGQGSHSMDQSEDDITLADSASKKPTIEDMKKNWQNHRDELDLLKKESEKVTEFFTVIDPLKQTIEESKAEHSKTTYDYFMESIKTLKENKTQISAFMQIRLAELGGFKLPKGDEKILTLALSKKSEDEETVSNSPPLQGHKGLIEMIAYKKTHRFAIEIILQDLKRVFSGSIANHQSVRQKHFFYLQEAGFKLVDLMVMLGLEPESVRSLFQEPQFVENFIRYLKYKFHQDIYVLFQYHSLPYITESWYWQHLHYFFKVLSEDEEKIINIYVLKSEIRGVRNTFATPPELSSLMDSLESDGFKSAFGLMDRSKLPPNRQKINQNKINRLVMRIIEFLEKPPKSITGSWTHNKRENIKYFLYNTLDLIERYVSPGIIKLITNPTHQDFEDTCTMTRLSMKIDHLRQESFNHLQYSHLFYQQTPQSNSRTFSSKSYADQVEQLLSELERTLQIIKAKKKSTTIVFSLIIVCFEGHHQSIK